MDMERLDAIILAAAGVRRLNMENRISEYLPLETVLPAVGQGSLCLEIRSDDSETQAMVECLDDPQTRTAVSGERAFLGRLEGGCQVPIAAHGNMEEGRFTLRGLVSDLNGTRMLKENITGLPLQAEILGQRLAERLIAAGADKILESLKMDTD